MSKRIFQIFFILSVCFSGSYMIMKDMRSRPTEALALNQHATTAVTVIVVCGDGLTDGDEICDKGNPPMIPFDVGTATCPMFGYQDGYVTCADDCLAYDTEWCYTCGNGTKERAEECDTADFGDQTCESFGFNSGILSCTLQCRLNIMDCYNIANVPGGTSGGAIGGGGSRGGGSTGFPAGRDTPLPDTKVVIKGTAYPNSEVHILKDSAVLGLAKADAKAEFNYESSDVNPGVINFSFWAEDKNKLKSILYTLTFRVTSNAVTNISGVHLPPTIGADKITLKGGEDITIFGSSIPFTDVFVEINSTSKINKQSVSDDDGEWSIIFNTSPLKQDENHTAKAYFQKTSSSTIIKSGYSGLVNFYLGEQRQGETCPGADLNKDKRVNLTDFSILLYFWGTNNMCADQNNNAKVDLPDFSIMMYHWTG